MAVRRVILCADVGFGTRTKRRQSEADLDITPMIDVTFLLLIFFMVTSTMQPSSSADLPLAKHGVGIETRSATVITLRAAEGDREAPPVILLGDDSAPEGTVAEVTRLVEESVRQQRPAVIIKAERDVPHGFVQEITRAVTAVEGSQFYLGVADER